MLAPNSQTYVCGNIQSCFEHFVLFLKTSFSSFLDLNLYIWQLQFTSFLFLSAQFEPEESLTLIKISLKASKREKGLDEKFTKIKFQLLTSSLAARRVFSAYIHYKSTFGRLMSEMKFIFIKFPLPALCPEAQRKFEKVF